MNVIVIFKSELWGCIETVHQIYEIWLTGFYKYNFTNVGLNMNGADLF